MYKLSTYVNALHFIETNHSGVSCAGMTPDAILGMAVKLGWTIEGEAVQDSPKAPKVPEAPKDRLIQFGRNDQSMISFWESELKGDAKAIRFMEYMQLLMVDYKLTVRQSLELLHNDRLRVSSHTVYASQKGWGTYIHEYVNSQKENQWAMDCWECDVMEVADCQVKDFIASELTKNAINLIHLDEILASMKL